MKIRILAVVLIIALALTGCAKNVNGNNNQPTPPAGGQDGPGGPGNPPFDQNGGIIAPDDESSFGDDLGDLGALDGKFEGEQNDVVIRCESGTGGRYKIENNVITFTNVSADSVYSISGKFSGSIVIDIGDNYNFELELCGFSLMSGSTNPITVLSGNEVAIQAKKNTENFIYDTRAAIADDDTTSLSGAIHSEVDLEISGKGEMNIVSDNNNGIHSKKDLQVKNLTLTVSCKDNAVKGNDSVSFENATATLIAKAGDCVKTSRSDISDKGNQRGIVSFLSGSYNIYAACDGVDSAYNVIIEGADTLVNIYTDKYSNYSDEVTAVTKDVYYIRFNNNSYKYSVKYYNSDEDFTWVNAEYHSSAPGGMGKNYYFYSFPKLEGYSSLQFYMYTSDMEQGQDENCVVKSDFLAPSMAYDTIAVSVRNSVLNCSWTNYTTSQSRPGGGMNDGNIDKGDHSTKGIKALNEIIVNDGYLNIKSYDDAIHAKNDTALENNHTPTGNVSINGGNLTLYSNDDGVHADGNLIVRGGNVNIVNSYEGMEGTTVSILDGVVNITSKDDGINATASSGTTITVGGGELYIFCGGDCLDSNSRTSYSGISFSGGKSLLITTSGGNSAIDSEQGYSYTAGLVVAVMPRGGMSGESTKCSNFSSVGKKIDLSLTKGNYLVCSVAGNTLTTRMSATISSTVVVLGDNGATVTTSASSSHTLDEGKYIWN